MVNLLARSGLALALLSSGCSGTIRSRLWAQDDLRVAMAAPNGVKGVIGYLPKTMVETDEYTQAADKDGKFITSDCNHVVTQKLVTVADANSALQIWYEPGFLESSRLGAQWSGGIFTSVNSESSPDQGKTIANLATAAAGFVRPALLASLPSAGRINCNAAPSLVGLAPLGKAG